MGLTAEIIGQAWPGRGACLLSMHLGVVCLSVCLSVVCVCRKRGRSSRESSRG